MTSPAATTHAALSTLGGGFSSEAFGSQGVFRSVLQALSHPACPVAMAHDAETPSAGHAASAAVLLALLDSECTLWLSAALAASQAGLWLRFHTGCVLVQSPEQASFIWVAAGDRMPALAGLQWASDERPDQSATCLIDVRTLSEAGEGEGEGEDEGDCEGADRTGTGTGTGSAWRLSGPGIRGVRHLRVTGLPEDFERQWAANHGAFPRGVDLLLASATHIAGLPRTTRIHQCAEES